MASSLQVRAYSAHNELEKTYILWKGVASLSDLSDNQMELALKKQIWWNC